MTRLIIAALVTLSSGFCQLTPVTGFSPSSIIGSRNQRLSLSMTATGTTKETIATSSEFEPLAGDKATALDEEWRRRLRTSEVQNVRKELIKKYLAMGRTEDVAIREVDEFLNDRERSTPFLEMRHYAKVHQDLGPEIPIIFILFYLLGLAGSVIMDVYTANRVRKENNAIRFLQIS